MIERGTPKFILAKVLRRRRSSDLPAKSSLLGEYLFLVIGLLVAGALLVTVIRSFY